MRFGMLAAALMAAISAPAFAGDSPQQEKSMAKDPKIAVVERQIEAWNTRDWAGAGAMFADDAVLHSMMIEPINGQKAIAERIAQLGDGTESIKLDVRNIGRVGDVVFIERVDRFVYKGHAGAVPVVGVLEVEGDKIKAWREYYDRAMLVREMGLSEDFHKAEGE
ncbi:nuclear transport factor 2 family protein [Sphingomonas colocasiae]|uniref:Nuclear transport factor 2 family protein n=1 Tax=Sphingomonas colocasiae TaxID=1848973 RepID=A0ABS7PLE4_9SPHN|nr:nuclear transport factor 2 family protein [Sphingomonas colocasiae]MBY8822058.1 nuclear transport factor 2 family protein [Sphingomonas colocasiae]